MGSDFTIEQLQAILESVHDAIYIGNESEISICNQQCFDMLGIDNPQDLKKGMEELSRKTNSRYADSGKKVPLDKEPFMLALKGKKVVQELIVTNFKTGEDKFIRCAASPVRLHNNIMGAVVVNTDITDKKLAEKKSEEAIREVENVNKELQAFTYAVSHDLKSPLTSIYGLAVLLLKSDESSISDKDKYMLNLIVQSSEKLGKLINRLLELSKISKIEFNYTDVDLSKMAHMILDNNSFEQSANPDIEIEDNLIAYGDEALLQSVIQNLLSNAIKYSSKREHPKIKFGVKKGKDKKIFYIRDNGVGFSPALIHDLFKPFKRLHDSSEFAGTGIGLSTVKRIIERHGGNVWAEAQYGKGATFYFSLPDRAQLAHLKDREPIFIKEPQKNKIPA